jgi:Bacterial membrane protein YfhO
MKSSDSPSAAPSRWTSLWIVALLSLLAQLALCQFFSFGGSVPVSLDVNPSNLWKLAYHFPPTGSFEVLNWLGVAFLPQPLNPLSFAAAYLPPWWFFTTYAPLMATLALLAMAAFLRELELPRPAALFGGVIFAWQGDILSFVYPGHYAYMATWPFFAVAAWGALRAERTGHWAYAVISGASCGLMVGLQPDRGGIASLLIAALYLAPIFQRSAAGRMAADYLAPLRHLILCVSVAAIIAMAPLLALFQSYIVGVKMAGVADRAQTYKLVTQFSIGPAETLTYLVPGFFGWHINNPDGPYWGWVGEWPDWPKNHQGMRNLTLALSTTGTVATVLALIGAGLLLPGRLLGPDRLSERQRFYGRVLLGLGFVTLILAWGWHTPLYRPLFALPLMDKWRNPLKWLEMTNFALVVLSAIGVQQVMASLEADVLVIVRRRLVWFTHGVLALLGVGLLVSYPLAVVSAATFQADGYEPLAIANIMNTMHTTLLVALGVMTLFCLLLHALWQPDKLRGWTPVNPWLHRLWQQMLQPDYLPLTLALGLAALAVVQLGWVANQFIQPIPIVALTATNPLLEALRSEGNIVRVAVPTGDSMLKDNLLQNQFAAPNMNISCLDVSAASRIPDDLNAFLQALDNDEARLWFLAGVKNVAVPQQAVSQMRLDPGVAANIGHADGYTLEPTGSPDLPSHALVGMKDYLAKATLVPQAEFFTTDEALLKRLKDPTWSPRESLLLNPGHKLPRLSEKADGTSAPDKVDLKTYTPTEIKIEVESAQGDYVLINDQYDPDWQVQVNGHNAELLRADYIMRAVEVPPGESTVTMHYVAHYHLAGLNPPAQTMNNLSDGAMLAAWLIAGFALWRKRPV